MKTRQILSRYTGGRYPRMAMVHRNRRTAAPAWAAVALVLALPACENRLPMEPEAPPATLLLTIGTQNAIIAETDTVQIAAMLVDSNMNVIVDSTLTISMRATRGILIPRPHSSGEEHSATEYLYYFPHPVSTVYHDTIFAWYVGRGVNDTLEARGIVTVEPRAEGNSEPAYINVSVRTDAVYKSGSGWTMFVDGAVSDRMGNPVKGSHNVAFTFEESGADTALLSLRNVAKTGALTTIQAEGKKGGVSDSVPGGAISVLTFDSRAIADTVIIRGTIVGKPHITDLDTLELPLPTQGLKLTGRYARNRSMHVPLGKSDTAVIRISLRDAFNVPIPGRTINITTKPGGDVLPLCPVYDSSGAVVASQHCSCDTVFVDSCLVRDSLDPTVVVDTVCHDFDTVYTCTPFPEPATGITDEQGRLTARIVVTGKHRESQDNEFESLVVTLTETATGVFNDDLSIPVTFYVPPSY